VPDTSIIDRRLAMLAANPPDPTPDPEPPAPAPSAPPPWRLDPALTRENAWFRCVAGSLTGPIVDLRFIGPHDPARPHRVAGMSSPGVVDDLAGQLKAAPEVEKYHALKGQVADADLRAEKALAAAEKAAADRKVLELNPEPDLPAKLRALDDARAAALAEAAAARADADQIRGLARPLYDRAAALFDPPAYAEAQRRLDAHIRRRGEIIAAIEAAVAPHLEELIVTVRAAEELLIGRGGNIATSTRGKVIGSAPPAAPPPTPGETGFRPGPPQPVFKTGPF
jgi:hypothetical protein